MFIRLLMAACGRVRICRITSAAEKHLGSNRRQERASFSNGMMKEKREELKEGKHQGRQEAAAMEREERGCGGGRRGEGGEQEQRSHHGRRCVCVHVCSQNDCDRR